MMFIMSRALFLVIVLALAGCATIPPEAPELSVELGKRISAIEEANITLLKRYFDFKRSEVDKFIEKEWVPDFANQFFSNHKISSAWNIIVRENDEKENLKFLIKTGPKLQNKIHDKRLELIQPLEELERRIEDKIRGEYRQALSMNNSITSFLISASKVAENRNRYLEMIGITDGKIGDAIDKTDDAVDQLIGKTVDLEEKVGDAEKVVAEVKDKFTRAEEFLVKMKEIRDSI